MMDSMGYLILSIVIAYFLGTISPSAIQAKAKGIDIHEEGSGNPGTTNTLRVLGKKAAFITLVVDISKGIVAVLIGSMLAGEFGAMCSAFAAFLGHLFPVEMKFKGGKGVAVAFGVLLALDWRMGIAELIIIVAAVLITRKVSFGSLFAAGAFPFVCYYFYPEFLKFGIVMAILVIWRHRSNIKRLINHEEDNISFNRKVIDSRSGEVLREKEEAKANDAEMSERTADPKTQSEAAEIKDSKADNE